MSFNSGLIGNTPWTFNSTSSAHSNHSIGSPLGMAFTAIGEANARRQEMTNFAMSTGQHNYLPTGSYQTGTDTTIIRENGYTRYENKSTGMCSVVTDDGQVGQYNK